MSQVSKKGDENKRKLHYGWQRVIGTLPSGEDIQEGRKRSHSACQRRSGHKTISVFKRYNLVTQEELAGIKWPERGEIAGTMDTNMDTKQKEASHGSL